MFGLGPGRVVLIGGSLITAGIALIAFRKKVETSSRNFMVGLLGVMAATLVVTYHAHTHSAIAIIPILLYLYMDKVMNERVYAIWLLSPSVFNLLQFLIGALILLSILPFSFAHFVNFSIGLCIFGLNLYLLGWSVHQVRQKTLELSI
jgi:hypothetical protein